MACPLASRSQRAEDNLLQHYRRAMELEVDFFSAQPYRPPRQGLSLLVVDFDDTCTATDSIGLLMQTAIEATVAQADGSSSQQALRAELQGQLQWLVQNYGARRSALLEEILPEPEEEAHDFDMAWLGDFIDRLSEFDREMNGVVIESGILSGIKKGMLARAGASISMQPGCLDLLRRAADAGVPTYVVSVNWSAEMVRAALAQEGLSVVMAEGDGQSASAAPPGSVVVYANELEYFGDTTTGNIRRRCECAGDKGRLLDDLLLDLAAAGEGGSGISVYIGDSMTDIPPLISADAGILVGRNDMVRQVAAVAGIDVRLLVAAPLDLTAQESHADEAPVLWEAGSWDDISAFLFNQQFKLAPRKTSSFKERAPLNTVAHGKVPRVLAIAGSDSGGGAGIQADLKACMAAGVFCTTAVTALTAQNTRGVESVHMAPTAFIRQQIAAVLGDIGADVAKTGMLPTPEVVEAVAEELQAQGLVKLVVDPVLVSTSGDALATNGVAEAIKTHLLPLATIVTPNIPEASKLLDGRPINGIEGMKAAAEELHRYGPQWVLIKGGHLAGQVTHPDDQEGDAGAGLLHSVRPGMVTDILFDGKNMIELSEPHISTGNNHGTGCTLASTIAAELAKGADVSTAVRRAKKYVWRMLERSMDLPLGQGPQKPMNHGFAIADWSADLATAAAGSAGGSAGAGAGVAATSYAAEAAREQRAAAATRRSRIPNRCDLRVYVVTDPVCNAAQARSNAEAVRMAIDGGATIVQLREKKIDGGAFLQQAAEVLEVCKARGVPLLINDRVDVALAVGADGVHVGQGDLPAVTVRRMIGADLILGVSVKTVEEALRAEADGADYLGAGAVFPTGTKESEVIGLQRLQAICAAVDIPVVAIGGVKVGNAAETVAAGCAGAAVVSGVFAVASPADACRELLGVVDAALAQRGIS
ncbi:thiamine biosynthetic bifunctional enzyme chloroplastic isoform C [Micractinium conductrix]|uniref:thiamine phosphate synthase n=1 Tax=Micractinium conductrix TaxID=554055 RepID=A0A2P6VM97_9CHLO|nr:thiamine biosynthetic bifunctional enzyme chloroplastic isoform C [Micractinium conductrix]|eukprot:PSC75210.1 thiamine biosynthetic bifunctional enzyme chloroplastic isoform C [Micractinium conductrix]